MVSVDGRAGPTRRLLLKLLVLLLLLGVLGDDNDDTVVLAHTHTDDDDDQCATTTTMGEEGRLDCWLAYDDAWRVGQEATGTARQEAKHRGNFSGGGVEVDKRQERR